MSKNHHGGPGPVPPGNRAQTGPAKAAGQGAPDAAGATSPPGDEPQDGQRRLGDFVGKGEHSITEPGGKSGNNTHG